MGVFLAMFGVAANVGDGAPRVEQNSAQMPVDFSRMSDGSALALPPGVPAPTDARWLPNHKGPEGLLDGRRQLVGTPNPDKQIAAPENVSVGQADANNWAIINSPNALAVESPNILVDVTCRSASDCWAVGFYNSGVVGSPLYQTLIVHWDGIAWTIVSSPNTSAAENNELLAVTCTAANECWAVGYSPADGGVSRTLAEHWDGTSWTLVSSPNTSGTDSDVLEAVTCASANDCWAAGSSFTASFVYRTLTEHWDGTAWTIVSSANLGNSDNAFTGVTCVSGSDCWAVGYYEAPQLGAKTLIERWNGTSWSTLTALDMSASHKSYLTSVRCVSASDCWSVGYYSVNTTGAVLFQTLIEHWDGTLWTMVVDSPNANTTQHNRLAAVTCASTSNCWAVGSYISDDGFILTLVEHWEGTSWTVVNSPNSDAAHSKLVGVTCAAASACWAVGSSYTSGVVNQTLIEYWDSSSWAVINSPNAIAPGPTANRITDVACLSASDCWAVGFYDADSQANYQTLTEHWDGTSWAIINSPNTNTELSNVLESVTCASTNDCWAVGDYISNNSFPQISKALIEHWDGHSWAIIDAPTGDFYWLQAVTCAASNNCWAVGYFAAGFYQTLIEHWDGTSWSIVSSANPAAAENNVLLAVTCASASDCWATGAYGRVFQTLIEHWDGTSWTVVSSPNASAVRDNLLQSIACASGSDCWAVGYYSAAGIYQTLIEHWNGTSWTIISSPNTDVAKSNILTAAACASGNDCWAVGYYSNGKYLQTLAQHWDGTSWTIAHSRNTSPTQSNYLLTVTCLSPSECWAAGSYDLAPNRFQTLIEHYSLSSVQLSTGVSRKTHGSAGTFDVDLPLDGSGIECRSGGQGGDYTMVFTFANPLTSVDGANVTSGAGSVSSSNVDSNDAHNYIVALTGVTNAQKITVSLTNVTDSFGNFSARVPISMAVLVGDTTGDAIVNSTDIAQSKSQSGQAVTDSNFREDVTADGNINSADIALTKSKSGTALPQ